MVAPRVLILRSPGTNCDGETAFAFEQAGALVQRGHVDSLLENARRLSESQILCIPGGFSYGDDIAAGRILGATIRFRLADSMRQFHSEGKLILGICNGFQALLRSGLLLPVDALGNLRATLTWNDSGRFEDRWVVLRAAGCNSIFFSGIERLYLPVAHAEGKFVPRDPQVLEELGCNKQIALRYSSALETCEREKTAAADGNGIATYPDNPSGSAANIAGICDPTGRVCGLMPHPERHIDRTQHPRWTRGEASDVADGLRIFQNAVRYFR